MRTYEPSRNARSLIPAFSVVKYFTIQLDIAECEPLS